MSIARWLEEFNKRRNSHPDSCETLVLNRAVNDFSQNIIREIMIVERPVGGERLGMVVSNEMALSCRPRARRAAFPLCKRK